jgi:RNA polymerase sigma factor (sigma-70 family)
LASRQLSQVVKHLRQTALLQEGGARTDGQLLDAFIARRDEGAFELLLRRHGPMVLGVCRRLLSAHDAEDAFQATFLVLVRKAASIVPREMVANWLHGVAYNVARKVRALNARRQAKERQVMVVPERCAAPQDLWQDLQPLLDQELNGLPDKYRLPVVLCDLEGKTRKAAAQQLGWQEGTLSGRLSRARSMLARRLARHGFSVSGGALAAVLAEQSASASIPAALVAGTLQLAGMLAAGPVSLAVIPPKITTLMEGVMKAMLLHKLKNALTVCLVAGLFCGVGAAGYLHSTQVGQEQSAYQPPSDAPKNRPDPYRATTSVQGKSMRVRGGDQVHKEYVVQIQILGIDSGKQRVREIMPQMKQAVIEGERITTRLHSKESPPVLGRIKYLNRLFEKEQEGLTSELSVTPLSEDVVLVDLMLQKTEFEQGDENGMVTLGRTMHVGHKFRIGRLERFAWERDRDGKPLSWLEVSVVLDDGASKGMMPPTAPRPTKHTDWGKLQGTWVPIHVTHDGKEVETSELDRIGRVVFEGDHLTFPDRKLPAENVKFTLRFTLEPGTGTMLIDFRSGFQEVSVPYNYKFMGEDELRLSQISSFANADLLSKVHGEEGAARSVLTLKRQTNRNKGN